MLLRHRHEVELPQGVLLSVRDAGRAERRPDPEAPPWLRRFLPKSGLAGRQYGGRDIEEEEDPDDEDGLIFAGGGRLSPVSFDVLSGHGVGIVGTDKDATLTLRRILTRMMPPSTGSVVVRGFVAPLAKYDLNRYIADTSGQQAVAVVGRFLNWPRSAIAARRAEILEFARLEELEDLGPRPKRNKTTQRLLFSTMLHMGASVYVLDEGIPSDDEFGDRVLGRLEELKAGGAAIIQRAGPRVEEVARLCDEVLWFDDGELKFRGRPVEVAVQAEKTRKEDLHPLSVPILASVPDGVDLFPIGVDGGSVEIDFDVLRKELRLALTLELIDEHGEARYLEQPEGLHSETPGLHRLRIAIPGGFLPDGVYQAKLLAEFTVPGSEPTVRRPLRGISFGIVADGYEDAEAGEEDVIFELIPDPPEAAEDSEVEWSVGPAAG